MALETGEVIVPVQRPGINQLVVTTFSGIATSNSVPELSYDPLTMASDGTLFVSGRQNGVGIGPVLYSQSSTGEIRTNLYGRGALGPATFHPNGTLLAGSSAGKLYALNTDLDLRTNGWPTARADVRQSGNLAGPSPTPTTPLGFIATQGEFVGQVRLNWSGAEEFRYIEVWRSATTDPGDAVLIASNLVSTTYFDANAPGGTNYYFLRAINSAGISGMTEPVPGTVSSAASVKWIAPVGTHSGVPSLGYDGVVYVPGNDRSLRAYSDSGALLWTVPEVCYITDRPVVVGPNDLLHSWEGGEWVLMSTNGSVIDRVPIGAIGTGDLSVSGDGSVYVNRGELNAYSPELTLKWQGRSASGNAAAIAPDGNLYVPARLNFEAPRTIEAYSPIGSNLWSFATSAPVDSLALREEGVLAVADGLVAIGFDGVKQWSTNLPIIHEPIIGADGSIFAIAAETNFHALNPDGTVKWSYPVKATGSLVSKEGNVYLNVSGGVLALSATGQKLWTYASTNYIFPSTGLELSTAGSLYFSLGTNLVALNTFDQPSDDSWSTKHGNMQRTGQLRSSKAASIDLVSIEKLPTGTHRIQLKRVGGETMVLEASQNLTNWHELEPVINF